MKNTDRIKQLPAQNNNQISRAFNPKKNFWDSTKNDGDTAHSILTI